MRSWLAFMKKEFTEQLRSGKLLILGLVFLLFGVMNPAVAKLTPLLLEVMEEALAQSGMFVTEASVSAMDSWVQFFKNMPMGLIVFVLLESRIFTKEYSSGTLVLSLTKGLERFKVVAAKALVLAVLWTLCYWLCFGITCGANEYFWDNSAAQNLFFSVVCWWLFGVMLVALMVLFSTLFNSNIGVLLGSGGAVLAFYLIGLIPKCGKYLPVYLTGGNSLIYGLAEPGDFVPALLITLAISAVCFALSFPVFNKKKL